MMIAASLLACATGTAPALANPGSIDGEEPEMFEDSYTFVCPDGGYESGCERDDVERAVMLDDAPQDVLSTDCLYRTQADCTVIASGQMAAFTLGTTLYWQLLALQPKDGPETEMMVLFEQDGAVPVLLLSHQTEGYFDPPVAVRDGDGKFLLQAPARNRGLGNADIILMNSGEGWNWVTADQLIGDMDRLLPAGFTIASPLEFNLREGSAYALVRRDSDAGCCATGGVAYIDFEMSQPHSMNVSSLEFQETTPGTRHRALVGYEQAVVPDGGDGAE
ncbi:hypothetical protein [Citromicrobium bathyomarinum]|uniref:hypothetical protein n=1 Tax=Citromicrobium bathyomarinum TaxID=72174 RepID=UPI00315AE21B